MTQQALQFTLEQVAQSLDLSEAVVSRLSQYFRIPRKAYQDHKHPPSFVLFEPHDVALLRKAQELLSEGASIAEVNAELAEEMAWDEEHTALEDDVAAEDDWDEADATADLMDYPQDEALKEHLAQATLKHYRQRNNAHQSPFKALVNRLQKDKPERPISVKMMTKPAHTVSAEKLVNPLKTHMLPPMPFGMNVLQRSWMTPALREEAREIQQSLRLKRDR